MRKIIILACAIGTSAFSDNPIFRDYKSWTETETHLLLLHSKANHPNHSGTMRLIHKSTGKVVFDRQVGYLTHLWMSPDTKFIVGFSCSQTFTRRSGYNLIILDTHGNILYTKAIDEGSPHVKNIRKSVTEWIDFYRSWNPDVKLECDDLGQLVSISFYDVRGERATIPIELQSVNKIENKQLINK